MAWSGRSWDEIPVSTWDNAELHIDPSGSFFVEFDYTGFNYHTYHYPRTEIEFEDFLDIYDELVFWDVEFEVSYGED